jgi:hypothetical protein
VGAASGRRVAKATRQNLSAARLAAAALVLLILAAACSGGDDDSSNNEGSPSGKETARSNGDDGTTSTTKPAGDEPPGTKPIEVADYLQDLLDQYDDIVTMIVADPTVVDDRDSRLVERFLDLFEPGSDFADGALDDWAEYAENGTTIKPLVADYPVNVTRLEGPPQTVNEDEVTFGQCTTLNLITYQNGQEQQRFDRQLLPGNGRAVRVDDEWRLVEITTPENMQGCFRGSGVPQ